MHLSDRPVDVIGRGYDAALYSTDAPDRHPGDLILGRHPTALAAAPSYLDRAGRPTTPEDLLRHCTIRGALDFAVKSRCGAVAVGSSQLWPPLSSGGVSIDEP
jgi:hypothetical protein